MRKTLAKKLRSNRGMALILALLLFLICAAVGGVALTAGTASAGTISERTQFDQRYFSVTSAAELLRKTFDNVRVNENMRVFQKQENKQEREITGTVAEFVKDQSLYLLRELGDSDWKYEGDKDVLPANADKWLTPEQYTVTASIPDMNAETLAVLNATINATIEIDRENGRPGELNFIVTSDIANQKFSLKIKYAASVLKEVKTTASGQEAAFQVEWKIGAISLAD